MWAKLLGGAGSIFTSLFGKIAIIASLVAACATIYNLYNDRAMYKDNILVERGRAQVIEIQKQKELAAKQIVIEEKDKQIAELQAKIESMNVIIGKLNDKNNIISKEIRLLRKSIQKLETEAEITKATREIMKCLESGCQ